jgi:hypothetical protein
MQNNAQKQAIALPVVTLKIGKTLAALASLLMGLSVLNALWEAL